jgi:hypothetical protein
LVVGFLVQVRWGVGGKVEKKEVVRRGRGRKRKGKGCKSRYRYRFR